MLRASLPIAMSVVAFAYNVVACQPRIAPPRAGSPGMVVPRNSIHHADAAKITKQLRANAKAAETTDAEIQALIDRLASKNPAPKVFGNGNIGPYAKYPPIYDETFEKDIWVALATLQVIGPRAFPLLLKHVNDKRYSLTGDGGNVDENRTVGEICDYLIEEGVSPFPEYVVGKGYNGPRDGGEQELGPRGDRPQRPSFPVDAKWAERRKNATLREVRLEVLAWMIAKEAKNPKKYDQKERDALQAIYEKCKATGEVPGRNSWIFSR